MLQKILVALDSSGLSEQIVQTLHQLQLGAESEIVIAHVLDSSKTDLDIASDRPDAVTAAIPKQQLEKLTAYQTALPCKSKLDIVTGDPAEEIIRLANIYTVELIVIGSRGLTGLDRIVRGSVSSQVVEDAPCSVLVVKLH